MLAFFRVFAFYALTAALLIWGLFALGWADAFELPGFESQTRTRTATQTVSTASRPWEETAALPVPKHSPHRTDYVPPSEQSRVTVVQQPARPPVQGSPPASVARPADPPPSVAPAQPQPPPRVETASRMEPTSPERPKQVQPEPIRPEPKQQVRIDPPPARPDHVRSEPPRPAVQAEQPRVPAPAPLATQSVAPPSPPAKVAEAAPVTRPPAILQPAPAPTTAPAASRQPAAPSPARWAPVRRVAGFGIDALADNLDEVRRGSGDVPCVVLQDVSFKAGTATLQPRSRTELELIAKVLNAQADHRLELGSRLGPGRPMASDAKLRADRVRVVRENLIATGVPAERLLAEANGSYERVTDDLAKSRDGRRQSIGICVHA